MTTKTRTADELARLLALMVGWSPSHSQTKREKATMQLWRLWIRAFESEGWTTDPKNWPELSDEAIEELAAAYDSRPRSQAA